MNSYASVRKVSQVARTLCIALGFVFLCAVSNARAEVSLYSDMWPASDVDESTDQLEMFGLATGESDDQPFILSHWMKDPSLNVLAYASLSGWGYRELNQSIFINDSSPMGEYKNQVQADDGFTHFGCAFSVMGLSAFTANYQHVSGSGAVATYSRCTTGACLIQPVRHKPHLVPWPPPFVKLFIVRMEAGFGGPAVCFSWAPIVVPSCTA
jgi:hypothetical protein